MAATATVRYTHSKTSRASSTAARTWWPASIGAAAARITEQRGASCALEERAMEWKEGQNEAWVGNNEQWSATIEKGVNYGWYYTLQK